MCVCVCVCVCVLWKPPSVYIVVFNGDVSTACEQDVHSTLPIMGNVLNP